MVTGISGCSNPAGDGNAGAAGTANQIRRPHSPPGISAHFKVTALGFGAMNVVPVTTARACRAADAITLIRQVFDSGVTIHRYGSSLRAVSE